MLNVLSIGSDRNLFDKESPVRRRVISYGHLADELHIIVFAKKSLNLRAEKISRNTWIYPTNSRNKLGYITNAIKLGSKLGKFNLVTAQDPFESGWVGYRLAKKLNSKLHIQIHTDFLSPFFKDKSLLNRIRVNIAKFVLKKADSIRVVSSRIKISLRKLDLKVESHILPVFVNPKKFESVKPSFDLHHKYPQFEQIIITTSRLEEEKNYYMAIKAFQSVLKDYPKTGYIIVGDGSLKNSLEEFSKREGLEKNIVFVGWQNELAPYYKGSDIYLSTSDYEGYGISMLEAVLYHVPVVSTDVGIAGDALLNNVNALICPVRDQQCIEKALREMLSNNNKRELFKENNKKIADNLLPQFEYAYFENYRKSWLKAL